MYSLVQVIILYIDDIWYMCQIQYQLFCNLIEIDPMMQYTGLF